jgi:hypothetical protein
MLAVGKPSLPARHPVHDGPAPSRGGRAVRGGDHVALASARRMRVEEIGSPPPGTAPTTSTSKPSSRRARAASRRRPRGPAEAVVVADHQLAHPEAPSRISSTKRRAEYAAACGEGDEDGVLEPGLGEDLLLLRGSGEQRRRGLRAHDAQRVRVEGDEHAAPPGPPRARGDLREHLAVAAVHAVEGADGDHRAAAVAGSPAPGGDRSRGSCEDLAGRSRSPSPLADGEQLASRVERRARPGSPAGGVPSGGGDRAAVSDRRASPRPSDTRGRCASAAAGETSARGGVGAPRAASSGTASPTSCAPTRCAQRAQVPADPERLADVARDRADVGAARALDLEGRVGRVVASSSSMRGSSPGRACAPRPRPGARRRTSARRRPSWRSRRGGSCSIVPTCARARALELLGRTPAASASDGSPRPGQVVGVGRDAEPQVARYVFGSGVRYSASRVAGPRQRSRRPDAKGSSVPGVADRRVRSARRARDHVVRGGALRLVDPEHRAPPAASAIPRASSSDPSASVELVVAALRSGSGGAPRAAATRCASPPRAPVDLEVQLRDAAHVQPPPELPRMKGAALRSPASASCSSVVARAR